MNTKRKIALGVAGAAVLAGATFGIGALSHAEDPVAPTPGAAAGAGFGQGSRGDMAGRGAGQGAGYGSQSQATYLAEKLGVAEADVAQALADYRAANSQTQTQSGRSMDDAQRAAHHEELANYLADKLDLDATQVLDALNGMDEARQAQRTEQLQTRLQTAVQQGRITQEQADARLQAHAAGEMGFGNGRR